MSMLEQSQKLGKGKKNALEINRNISLTRNEIEDAVKKLSSLQMERLTIDTQLAESYYSNHSCSTDGDDSVDETAWDETLSEQPAFEVEATAVIQPIHCIGAITGGVSDGK
eukprot:GHVS01068240.1.p1 GENE.GHVS01068240.1~~GHVS01068240.1.p1  ORF type:complete len:111 (-),score=4.88 GHVS01068240.1:313-645(-)